MKCASARLRKGKVLIQAFSQTTTDLWIAYGPVYVAAEDSLPAEIGAKVIAALANSKTGLPHPSQDKWNAVQLPMLEAAGVKSWATLEKGCKSVGIEDKGEHISIMPSISDTDGPRDLPEQLILSDKVENALGVALMEAFDACAIADSR